jgi:hypothetical protein
MRVLDGDQFLVRIFLGESDRFHDTLPLEHYSHIRLKTKKAALHRLDGFGKETAMREVEMRRRGHGQQAFGSGDRASQRMGSHGRIESVLRCSH